MNLNELNYYHRNPFYKQDFLPDRAWFNRQQRSYPSELPSGKDFLPSNSRKHYPGKFNHSQIEDESVLKSPQRYPFENRIAHNKTFMRSLNTIDIEGASSNTRVNQSIKNKYKARDQMGRRYQSEMKEKTQEEKRRDAAVQCYHTRRKNQLSRSRMEEMNSQGTGGQGQGMGASTINPEKRNPVSLRKDLTDEYKKFVMHNSSNKFHKDIPVAKQTPKPSYSQQLHTIDNSHIQRQSMMQQQPQPQSQRYQQYPYPSPAAHGKPSKDTHYQSEFNPHKQYSEEYQKILQYEQEMNRNHARRPSDVRKKNPTNLSVSFNLAGQSVVAS